MRHRARLISMIAAVGVAAGCARGPLIDTQQVTARRIAGALPTEDPDASAWGAVPEHPARLMVQDVTEPRLTDPGVELIRVRALHDGRWIVFRLEWDDPTADVIPESGRTSDAVAVQFPLAGGADVPNPAMGEAGKGVRIWYWTAVWQDDAERARAGQGDRIAALYPHAAVDHYPFAANPAARAEMERRYAPARAVGNPITVPPQTGPVQVLMAEGFGNVTPTPSQPAAGRGVFASGRWRATVARPLDGGAELGRLPLGGRTYVAFAVWDGAKGHAGARKMRSGWVPLVIEGA